MRPGFLEDSAPAIFFSGGHPRWSSDNPTQFDNSFCFPVAVLNSLSAKMKTLPKCDGKKIIIFDG